MTDNKAQAFMEKVAAGDDRGVRSEWLFEAQLHAVLNTLADPQAVWPARLRVRYDGPDLSLEDKSVLLQLLLHVEDDCVAIVERPRFLEELQELDTDETWSSVKRSVARLMQSVVRMRHDTEVLEVRMVEDMSELEQGVLKVAMSGSLMCAMRGHGHVEAPFRGPRVMTFEEVLAVLPKGKKAFGRGGWPGAKFYTLGRPVRQLDDGDWMIEFFAGGTAAGKGEVSLRTILKDEDFE